MRLHQGFRHTHGPSRGLGIDVVHEELDKLEELSGPEDGVGHAAIYYDLLLHNGATPSKCYALPSFRPAVYCMHNIVYASSVQ